MGVRSWLTGSTGTAAAAATNSTERPSASRSSADTFAGDSAVALTPSSSHSLGSPSPSPQPATPEDSSSVISSRANFYGFGEPPSKPINISTPRPGSASASPVAPAFAYNIANNKQPQLSGIGVGIAGLDLDFDPDSEFALDFNDVDMTTGPGFESAFGRSRQDSFVSAGPKPISMNPNRDQGRARRESLAGSLMSWGGVSVGSFIRDDLVMAGTSPFAGAPQASSVTSNSYIAKMENDFLRNFVCCGVKLKDMHDLLHHYEIAHHETGADAQPKRTGVQMDQRLSAGRPSVSRPSICGNRHDAQQFANQSSFGQRQQNMNGSNGAGGLGLGSMQMGQHSGAGNSAQKQTQVMHTFSQEDLDGLGDMEMEDPVGMMELDDSQSNVQQGRSIFGQPQRPQLQISMDGARMPQQALRSSQPSTPGAAGFGFQNNPTVSSVNTPTLTTQQALGGRMGAVSNGMDDDLETMGTNMNMGEFGGFQHDLNAFIDDPANRLYSPHTATVRNQRALQQQMAQFGLDQSQFQGITDPTQLAVLQRALGATMVPQEEDKPFKCPVIGCEKAYKNQNGLKYHKQHGHQTQQLHENGDGTFSIVNPETSTPYPGDMGMEKEKPFKCEYCNKRYKNLNGLKYHKTHSPQCEIAAQAAELKATWATSSTNHMPQTMSHGLPHIGEDMQLEM